MLDWLDWVFSTSRSDIRLSLFSNATLHATDHQWELNGAAKKVFELEDQRGNPIFARSLPVDVDKGQASQSTYVTLTQREMDSIVVSCAVGLQGQSADAYPHEGPRGTLAVYRVFLIQHLLTFLA